MVSRRSMSIGTHPMPPSDIATFNSGYGTAQLGVGALREHTAAEAGDHRREVERRPHAVDVHVVDAGVDVPAAAAHLVEAEGLDLHRLRPATGDGVHAHLAVDLAVELPDLVAPLVDDDSGRPLLQLRRQA